MKDVIVWGVETIFRLIYTFFSLFPLQNKVYFSNFSGKRYGDNPKYISEALHEKFPAAKIVWQQHYRYPFVTPDYVNIAKWPTFSFLYHMATSKVWVDSHLKRSWVKKRRGQYFIETWHGGLGFKKIEGDIESTSNIEEVQNAYYTAKLADVFVSNSDWLSAIYRRAFRYQGSILKCGYPKNDIFFKNTDEIRNSVRNYYRISSQNRIILYAPTFREGLSSKSYIQDFEKVKLAFEKRFDKSCIFFIRLHPLMIKVANQIYEYSDSIINVTGYGDTQELLIASDYLLTDYSSIIFDFMLMKKPGFLYVKDLSEYEQERGLYWKLSECPFPYAMNEGELIQNIMKFNKNEYEDRISEFENKTGLYEKGTATETVINLIASKIEK